jgi:hypothetical protein
MSKLVDLPSDSALSGSELIYVSDAGVDKKTTVAALRQPSTDHIAASNNPHGVTKSQVGLGNVDNTSDANKPVSTPQATALAPKGLLSASGLTLPGTGLAGRQSSGAGALQLITIGTGLNLAGGVLSAPDSPALVNERFIEVNAATTDTDYLVTLQGTTSRTLTLKADSPVGTQIAARNDAGNTSVTLTVTAPVGGSVVITWRAAALFVKTTLGWLQIAEKQHDLSLVQDDTVEDGVTIFPNVSCGFFTLTRTIFEAILPTPTSRANKTLTLHNLPASTFALLVDGDINGISAPLSLYPGETLQLHSTGITWRTVSGPQAPRHKLTLSSVVNNNATANTLADIAELGFAVIPGTYRFRFVIRYDAAATTTGARFTVNGPTTSALTYRSLYTLTATTETLNHGLTAFNQPAAANATSLTTGNMAIIEGIATFSAAGTLLPRFASEVSSSAITVLPGSTGELIRLA